MDGSDLWSVLGLSPGASVEQLKAAFRQRSRDLHPDRGGDERAFATLVEAYRSLLPVVESTRPRRAASTASAYGAWTSAASSRIDLLDVDARPRRVVTTSQDSDARRRADAFGRVLEDVLAG